MWLAFIAYINVFQRKPMTIQSPYLALKISTQTSINFFMTQLLGVNREVVSNAFFHI